jgi:hypothetical protein
MESYEVLVSVYGQELVDYVLGMDTLWTQSMDVDALCINIELCCTFSPAQGI